MAISDHQNVSPIETMTAPRTTLNTLMLPPNQNVNWCQGLPCRAPAGMWSMCRFSTYRPSWAFRAADSGICVSPPGRGRLGPGAGARRADSITIAPGGWGPHLWESLVVRENARRLASLPG